MMNSLQKNELFKYAKQTLVVSTLFELFICNFY